MNSCLGCLALALVAATTNAADGMTDMSWLSGRWCRGSGANLVEEYWLPANSDLMLGVSRTVKSGKAVEFEFIRIATVDGVPTYLAQPSGRPPTAFKQTAAGEHWIRFENPQHDFPTRIEYRREGDALKAEIAGPGKDGKEKVIPFPYQKCTE